MEQQRSGNMHFFEKSEIESSIAQIEKLLSEANLANPDIPTESKQADFTWLMINLRDLLAKTEKFTGRIDFTDDVIPMWEGKKAEVKDATSLIKCFRDAMCHRDSFRNLICTRASLTLGSVTYGAGINRFGDFEIPTCDYEDELMFICGPQRIYFKRHIVRSFNEAREKLTDVLERLGKFDIKTGDFEILTAQFK